VIVRSRAPLRLGLGGGGTDVSPYSDLHGGMVLNATVDLYACATIESTADGAVHLEASDLGKSLSAEAPSSFVVDGVLDLHKGVYNRIVRDFNHGNPLPIHLTTYTEVPAGSGLGSSSSLVVAMVRCFAEYLDLPLGDYDLAHLAFEIERIDLGLNGGKQDQYASTFGGFNFIEFQAGDRVIVNPLRVKNWVISELESSLVLFYTGASRESAAIIDEQALNVRMGNERSIDAMHELKREAIAMKECVLTGDLKRFAALIEDSWQAKKATASGVTNPFLDELHDKALDVGALAAKVSGAGGGGFMMFLVDPPGRLALQAMLEREAGRVMACHFTEYGSHAWKLR
jgi:D-glycero-alpha-D-manno-heptose-7-phosphate kinase